MCVCCGYSSHAPFLPFTLVVEYRSQKNKDPIPNRKQVHTDAFCLSINTRVMSLLDTVLIKRIKWNKQYLWEDVSTFNNFGWVILTHQLFRVWKSLLLRWQVGYSQIPIGSTRYAVVFIAISRLVYTAIYRLVQHSIVSR